MLAENEKFEKLCSSKTSKQDHIAEIFQCWTNKVGQHRQALKLDALTITSIDPWILVRTLLSDRIETIMQRMADKR